MGKQRVRPAFLGEFEQRVLLATLQAGDDAFALAVLKELDRRTGRRVDRGALYKTFDRLEDKGLVEWSIEAATPERGGHRRRLFRVTSEGVDALRASRHALFNLWDGLDTILADPAR